MKNIKNKQNKTKNTQRLLLRINDLYEIARGYYDLESLYQIDVAC
jgi:hypothetical protein